MGCSFCLTKDSDGSTGIVVFGKHLSTTEYIAAVLESIYAEGAAKLFIDRVFLQHGLPVAIILNRDP